MKVSTILYKKWKDRGVIMGHIYVMSDIHGNYQAFLEMLDLINFKDEDTLYVLGDVIDRGRDGIDILEFIRSTKNITLLMGNHEAMMYEGMIYREEDIDTFMGWIYNGGNTTYDELMKLTIQERNSLLAYVHNLDKYKILEINDKKYLLVHAGLMILPNFTLEELLNMQGDKLLWIRERFVSSKIETDYTVIFGHTPVITLDDYVETDDMIKNNLIWKRNNKIGIDCGCGYDKKLACLRLDDMKEYYIDISKQMIEDDVIEYKIKDKEIV